MGITQKCLAVDASALKYHGGAKRLGVPGAVWPKCHSDKRWNR